MGKGNTDGLVTGFLYDYKNLLHETDGMGGDVDTTYTATTNEYGDLLSEHGGSGELSHQYDAQWSTNALLDDSGTVQGLYSTRRSGWPTQREHR